MKLKSNCPTCQKELRLKSEVPFANGYLRAYTCGHSFFESSDDTPVESEFTFNFASISGKFQAYDFQSVGVQFIAKSNYNCLIADPMGLGKTIQALLAAREAKNEDGTFRFARVLVLTVSACTYQWFNESKEWFNNELWSTFVISGTKAWIPPGFRMYIMSMDTLPRFAKNGGLKQIQDLDFDLVIVDECHSFKNPDSARSQALLQFLQNISESEVSQSVKLVCNMCKHEWTEAAKIKINLRKSQQTSCFRHDSKCPKCEARIATYQDKTIDNRAHTKGLILLSGTPILNRADEYFVPLNLLKPDTFTSSARFKRDWLEQDPETGKFNRIKRYRLDEFRKLTSTFILRREKSILTLPPFRRAFETIQIEDSSIATAYNRALRDLDSLVHNSHKLSYWDLQDHLMTLRRITAVGKIPFAAAYVETFLDTTEGEKIAIGIHHEAVRDGLFYALTEKGIRVEKISGEDSAEQKARVARAVNDPDGPRVVIINMLAGGTGLNLQGVNNVLVLERQWNAAKEEQFEGRFWREGQQKPVYAEYMLAVFKHNDRYIPTLDTYFSALVEQKRQICGESLDGWDFTDDPEALKRLIEDTLSSRF